MQNKTFFGTHSYILDIVYIEQHPERENTVCMSEYLLIQAFRDGGN